MISCKQCDNNYIENSTHLECSNCKSKIEKTDGIFYFAPNALNTSDYHSLDGLKSIAQVEDRNFWFITRKKLILKLFNKFIDKKSKIMEVGAGSGNLAQAIKNFGYTNLHVGDIQKEGLEMAKMRDIQSLYQFDITQSPFKKHFDVISLFDVLEHIEEDEVVLKTINNMLTVNGTLFITVPAHMWLWNRRDVLEMHKRRYNMKELVEKLERNGFKIRYKTHFFITILPLLFLRSFLTKNNKREIDPKEYEENAKINPFINQVLHLITAIENRLFPIVSSPIGGSIAIIAQKIV